MSKSKMTRSKRKNYIYFAKSLISDFVISLKHYLFNYKKGSLRQNFQKINPIVIYINKILIEDLRTANRAIFIKR